VAVVLWFLGNHKLENLVIDEKKTTPTTPMKTNEMKLNLKEDIKIIKVNVSALYLN
jgi:hypothetical protein